MKRTIGLSLLVVTVAVGVAACVDAGDVGEEGEAVDTTALLAQGAASGDRYIVKMADYGKGKAALQGVGASVLLELPNHAAVAAHIPAAAIAGLQNHPAIELIEADPKRELFSQTTPYGISMVQGTDPTIASASPASKIKVCIIDSGLYSGHEDFAGISVTGESSSVFTDGCGHGTHVAGTVAAANNSVGVVGVGPNAVALHIVKVFGDDCSWTYASGLVAALDACKAGGAKVVSMSLGGGTKSVVEDNAFATAYNEGILSIAAAGNDGSTRLSYPASYTSVVSVAAIDSNKVVADFSQKNSAVDVAAPGVGVLSSVPWSAINTLAAGGATYQGGHIENALLAARTGALVDGGLCTAAGSWAGKVVLCQRGTTSFYDKVMAAQNGGATAVAIYNNVTGGFAGTLGDGMTSTIPAISLSMEDGQSLIASELGVSTTVTSTMTTPGSGYEAWDGTSMATPHVSGVAATIWSFNPAWTNAQIRDALQTTAQDLGTAGVDNSYGHGLVQAKAALDKLQAGGGGGGTCGAKGTACTSGSQCCSNSCSKGKKICN